MSRIGFGYDVHSLSENESLILGGVEIEHYKGTVGHSDGDVLIHAIVDAMLGAIAQKDIGYWFPDTDENLKNIDSAILLRKAHEILKEHKYKIGNIDTTLAAQKPKLKPYIDLMRKRLAEILGISIDDISVKATTTERLGFEGREEGISAYAAILVDKI